MVSVCMAVKNGSQFVQEQIQSILPQLRGVDELIVSDDHSIDNTRELIEEFDDHRIKLLVNPNYGLVSNFENALNACSGTYIFLADQDDIWRPNKIETMKAQLQSYDLVVCDCEIVDENLEPFEESFYQLNNSKEGLLHNLIRNSYMGCCMAFHRKILSKALPFPKNLAMHDGWIGLITELHFTKVFIPDKLVLHRKHSSNASCTGTKSKFSNMTKITHRMRLIKNLISLRYAG
jgi:glycosyltransferase involved in cell wall biosynthesis